MNKRQPQRQRAAHHRPGAAIARMRHYRLNREWAERDRETWEETTTPLDRMRGVRQFKVEGCRFVNGSGFRIMGDRSWPGRAAHDPKQSVEGIATSLDLEVHGDGVRDDTQALAAVFAAAKPGPALRHQILTEQDVFTAHERGEMSTTEAADMLEVLRPKPWWRSLWPW